MRDERVGELGGIESVSLDPEQRPVEPASAPTSLSAPPPAESAAKAARRLSPFGLVGGALLTSPIVVAHRHLPDSLPVLGAVAVTVLWLGWVVAGPRRRMGSLAGAWTTVFVIGAIVFAVTHQVRLVEARSVAVNVEIARLEGELSPPRRPTMRHFLRHATALRSLEERALHGDPIAVERLAAMVRARAEDWIDAEAALGRVGLGGVNPLPVLPWLRGAGALPRHAPLDALTDGSVLARIIETERRIAELDAALARWRRTRSDELAFADRAPRYDGQTWAAGTGRPAAGWPGTAFPWTALRSSAGTEELCWDWLEVLDPESLEYALVEAESGNHHAARERLDELALDPDPIVAASATVFGVARRLPPWDAIAFSLDVPLDVPDPHDGTPPWARAALDGLHAHADALASPPSAALDTRLRRALRGCELELARLGGAPGPRQARPEAVLLVELVVLLGAWITDGERALVALEQRAAQRSPGDLASYVRQLLERSRARRGR